MVRPRKDEIKSKILLEHNIAPVFSTTQKRKYIPLSFNMPRTYAMKMLEVRFGKPIELIIAHGSLAEVSEATGIERSTISKWRDRLGINYNEHNLPSCTDCPHASYECIAPSIHTCTLLKTLGRKDLIPLKRKELDLMFEHTTKTVESTHTSAMKGDTNEG